MTLVKVSIYIIKFSSIVSFLSFFPDISGNQICSYYCTRNFHELDFDPLGYKVQFMSNIWARKYVRYYK